MRILLAAAAMALARAATLVRGEQSAGEHAVELGSVRLPGGVRFCRLRAGDRVSTLRLVIVR